MTILLKRTAILPERKQQKADGGGERLKRAEPPAANNSIFADITLRVKGENGTVIVKIKTKKW